MEGEGEEEEDTLGVSSKHFRVQLTFHCLRSRNTLANEIWSRNDTGWAGHICPMATSTRASIAAASVTARACTSSRMVPATKVPIAVA